MSIVVIGLAGASGSGKTTTAEHIRTWCREEGIVYYQNSFARILKECLCRIFGWTMYQLDDQEFKSTPNADCSGMTPRQAMISLGDGWGRCQISNDIWVKKVKNYFDDVVRGHVIALDNRPTRTVFLVTDVRRDNEAHMIMDTAQSSAVCAAQIFVLGSTESSWDVSEDIPIVDLSYLGTNSGSKKALITDFIKESFDKEFGYAAYPSEAKAKWIYAATKYLWSLSPDMTATQLREFEQARRESVSHPESIVLFLHRLETYFGSPVIQEKVSINSLVNDGLELFLKSE